MALTSTEIDRCRYECRIALTRIGAEPYIGFNALMTKAIAPYLIDYGSTSTTTVAAASPAVDAVITVVANPVVPDPYNAPGFVPGAQVVVDLGPSQEFSTIRAVSGLQLTLSTLTNAHGTAGAQYPVILKGAEWIVRDIIGRIDAVNTELSSTAVQGAGTAQVDEIKLHASIKGSAPQKDRFEALVGQREQARLDLSYALFGDDIRKFTRAPSGGGSRVEIF